MAFGGVATGNIKAQLAARQTGIASETGKTPIAIARPVPKGKDASSTIGPDNARATEKETDG